VKIVTKTTCNGNVQEEVLDYNVLFICATVIFLTFLILFTGDPDVLDGLCKQLNEVSR
jgi:hypothetical protein